MRRGRGGAVLCAAGLVAALASCEPADPTGRLLERLDGLRIVEPRRSGEATHRPCEDPAPATAVRTCSDIGRRQDLSRWIDLVDEVQVTASDPSSTAASLRALAAVEVFSAPDDRSVLGAAVERLRAATAAAPDDPDARNDLAWALLVRGEALARPWDTAEALEELERLLARWPDHTAARFNRALALDRLGLVGEAMGEWDAVAASDPGDPWAGEARGRGETLRGMPDTNPDDAPLVDQIVRRAVALVDSGAPGGDSRWEALREDAEVLRTRGERGGADVVAALQGAEEPEASLVRGWRTYVEALDLWSDGYLEAAQAAYRRAARGAGDGTPAARTLGWRARVGAARRDVYESRHAEAEAAFSSVISEAVENAVAETRGHALWGLGLSVGRRSDYPAAEAHLAVAESLFFALGQDSNFGAVRSMKAEIVGANGDTDGALSGLLEALSFFGRNGGNIHQNILSTTGRLVASRHPLAAVRFHQEGLRVAGSLENPQFRVEALIRLAQAEARAGDTASASTHLQEARRGIPDIRDEGMRERVTAEYDELVGMHVPGLAPPERDSLLSEALTYFEEARTGFKIPSLLEARGRHRIAAGDLDGGTTDLRAALDAVEAQLRDQDSPVQRAALVQARVEAVDALVASGLAAGDTAGALVDLDRPRAAASARTRAFWNDPERLDAAGDLFPPDARVLSFGSIGGRVVVWVVGPSGVRAADVALGEEELGQAVARLRYLLRTSAAPSMVAPLTGALYRALLGPVIDHLDGARRLVVVTDGALHGLPFAVLGETPGALLERFELVHAPSLAFALTPPPQRPAPSNPMLAVSAGRWDAGAHPGLAPLRFAADEARAVAALAGAEGVVDIESEELVRSLPEARVFHFAGHGLFRSDRADLSELVLPGEAGGLRASRIAALDLSGLELAVLAACSTQEADEGRAGGLSGLTWSFLEAGAGGVIGSLWAVPDSSTSAFMVDVHRRIADGADGSEALRAAQLDRVRAEGNGWGWTAFRYEGEERWGPS